MKFLYQLLNLLIFIGLSQTSSSQCTNTTQYGGTTAPTNGGSNQISSCNYASEYAPITGLLASTNYQITSSIATDFITVHQGTFNGPVIASGVQPLNWTSTVGGTYFIHFNTNAVCGTQSSCRTTTIIHIQPFPDNPCTARTLTAGCSGVKLYEDNTSATNSGVANPSCGTYSGGDLWYSLIVPASGMIKIEAYAGTLNDLAMSVYSVTGNCSGTFTQLACDDNSGFGNMPEIVLTSQTPGNIIYVRVWDNNNNQTGTFEIDAADLSSDYCVTGNGIDQGSGCAQLTSATNNQLGSIWDADDKFDFTADFTYDFTVNLGNNDGGADGITFVIQNDPAALGATGTSGGAMGAGGITNSLIVEIDTYLNTEDRNDGITGVLCSGGPDPDHLDIWLNGDVNPGGSAGCPGIGGTRYIPNAVNLLNGAANYNIENGLDHILRITYTSASQTLTATVLNAAATVTYGTVSYSPINPMALFGTNAPYFGFTASTGGLNNQQSACLAPSLVLPIELISFNTTCIDKNIRLDWATLSEINNDYYTIERSIDAINFEELAIVNGSGNSNSIISYSWMDMSPLNEIAYYRLKQTDFDGKYSYSELMANKCDSKENLNIYPNPSTGNFSFEYFSEKDENLTVEIVTLSGQLIYRKIFSELPQGMSKSGIDLGKISDGLYFVNFTTLNNKVVHKLTVVNN